jgi:hypothetical protein
LTWARPWVPAPSSKNKRSHVFKIIKEPVETILRMGQGEIKTDGGGEFKIHCKSQYNNKNKKIEERKCE